MRLRSLTAALLPLLVHAAAFAVAVYAIAQIVRGGSVVNFAAWFAGAAVLHDLVLLPLYSLLDRLARAHSRRPTARGVAVINHVRVPALISALLLLVYFPLILGLSDRNYFAATGHHPSGYARDWALITAVLLAVSALLYAIRVIRAKR
jgi:Na+/melibiose symporter-like transporter